MPQPQRKVCECGRTYWTSVQFGNETKCDGCYKARRRAFFVWLDSLSDDEHHAAYERMRAAVAALGVTVPQMPEPVNGQDDIDATFYELMKGLDL